MAYAPSLSGGWVYEDAVYAPIAARVDTHIGSPVRALDRLVRLAIGESPVIGRLVSLGWHLGNGVLLFAWASMELPVTAAVLAVGLFWLHPLNTEAVAYMAARGDLLLATWVLLALLAAQRGLVTLAGVCAVLAITAKEVGIVALGIVPWVAWCRGHWWTPRQMVGWAIASVVMLAAFIAHIPRLPTVNPWWYSAGQLAALGRLVLLWAAPHGALTIDHDWIWITKPVAFGAAVWWACALELTRGWWQMAIGTALIVAAPRILLPLLDGQHERHLYVTTLALSLATASLLTKEWA